MTTCEIYNCEGLCNVHTGQPLLVILYDIVSSETGSKKNVCAGGSGTVESSSLDDSEGAKAAAAVFFFDRFGFSSGFFNQQRSSG